MWGNDEGDGMVKSRIPQLLPALRKHRIMQIATGAKHCLAVSKSGSLFSWGTGRNGRLGHGTTVDSMLPVYVAAFKGKKVIQVACGWSHSMCIASDGYAYAWGKGSDGQLGLASTKDEVRTARRSLSIALLRMLSLLCSRC